MLRLLAVIALIAAGQQAPPSRPIVVIGDLHMGPGRDAGGNWHAVEDFRWRDEFLRFLDAIHTAGGGNTDLVINGDLFELLQSPDDAECRHNDPAHGCTTLQALDRLETAIRAHGEELKAIGKFAAAGSNRVHVVPGDHDAALLIPEVWRRAARSFAAPSDRIALAVSGSWRSADGRVHVEHGHQLPLSADRFSHWPNPMVGGQHVERPWGEQAVVPFYDQAELRYPIIDNIAEEGVGVKFVAAAVGRDLPDTYAMVLKFLLTKTTWQQFRMDLDDGEVRAPAWDLARIRGDLAAFMSGSLPADDPLAPLVKEMTPALTAAVGATLSDQQIIATCDYRAAIRRARRRMERVLTQLAGVGPPVAECPRMPDTVGPAFEYYWRSRDQQVAQHITRRPGLEVIVFAHTHLLDRPFRPYGEDGPVVITSGAWQRTIHPNDLTTLDAPLESLPPCYSFARIPAATGPLTTESRSWRLNEQQQWTMTNGGC
jgi:hypothetical protein